MGRRTLILAALAALAAPASASGAVTIGSDLAPDPDSSPCNPVNPCTLATTTHPGVQVTSPLSGVIVRWRVRNDGDDGAGNPATLRVISPIGGSAVGISTGDTQTIVDEDGANPSTQVFPTRLSIGAGNLVALDVPPPTNNLTIQQFSAGPTRANWQPFLPNGGAPVAPTVMGAGEYTFNADVEPDADGDGFGDETQDQCPTNAGAQGACPAATPPVASPPAPKKCKKGRKLKQGKCVKKKRKKRKK